ncbi:MAG: hypothetical protein H6Q10_1610 [Acidobacteria bacterium]|nr:hypothetical protein [Acidobacteriota bacterium]
MVKTFPLLAVACLAAAAAGCGSDAPTPSGPTQTLSPPGIQSPTDNQQVGTVRPALTVRNGSSTQTGARTYDFQVSDNSTFGSTLFSKQNVEEGPGTTTVQVDVNLDPPTTYYWRARMNQGGASSDWVSAKFTTKEGGYIQPGALLDLLTSGGTVGERFGSTTFVGSRGIRLDNANSYVRYQLPTTVASGEFSMEVEGLHAAAPGNKLAIFSMAEGTGTVSSNPFEMFAQYRGRDGNPPNCITFKAVYGGSAYQLEFGYSQRASAVFSLNAGTTYFWQGTWNANAFRLIVKRGGIHGTTIYNRAINAPGGSYQPNPHVAYLGSNSGAMGTDAGSFPGMIVRNVWLGTGPRPSSLDSGEAVR